MPFQFNPIPAVHQSYLDLFKRTIEMCASEREEYASEREDRPSAAIYAERAIPQATLDAFAAERQVTRSLLEEELLNKVRDFTLPNWLKEQPDALVMYIISVEGRSDLGMRGGAKDAQRKGFKKVEFPILVARIEDFVGGMENNLLTDRRADPGPVRKELEELLLEQCNNPKDTVHLLSVTHSVVKATRNTGNGASMVWEGSVFKENQVNEDYLKFLNVGSIRELGRLLSNNYQPYPNASRVDFRIKSGAEKLFKEVGMLTGIAIKNGKPITFMKDYIAQRLRCPDDEMPFKFAQFLEEYAKHHQIDWEGAVLCYNLEVEKFVDQLPPKYKNYFRKISREHDDKRPNSPDARYLVAKFPICGNGHDWQDAHGLGLDPSDNVFCHNPLETQVFGHKEFNKIGGHNGRDHLSYKAAADDLRIELFNRFDWAVAVRMAATHPAHAKYLTRLFEERDGREFLPIPTLSSA